MKRDELFMDILKESSIDTVYQPIVSLKDGTIFGYEALSRLLIHNNELNIEDLFSIASKQNKLWELDILCRKKAFENAVDKPEEAMLFINVETNNIIDPMTRMDVIYQQIQEYDMNQSKIVCEVSERSTIQSVKDFNETIGEYRQQGCKIAVDDYGSGYSGMNRVCALSPDFLKIDIDLVRELDKDERKKAAVRSTIRFCKESGIQVIAEGIETEEELRTLVELGADYGQGYYLSRPKKGFTMLDQQIEIKIKSIYEQAQTKRNTSIFGKICEISKPQMVVKAEKASLELYEVMRDNIEITETFVVDGQNKLLGIITRNDLLQRYSGLYDCSLSQEQTVAEIMRRDYLAVESDMSISEVSIMAMERDNSRIYDGIAVTMQEKYIGTVSVKELLLATVQVQVNRSNDSFESPKLFTPIQIN